MVTHSWSKKGLSVIIAVMLLFALTVIMGSGLFYWFNTISSEWQIKQDYERTSRSIDVLGVKYLSPTRAQVGLRNPGIGYHIVDSLVINGQECLVIGSNVVESITELTVDCPVIIDENYEVRIYSDKGISTRSFTSFEIGVDESRNLQLPSNLTVEFRNSNTCDVWQTKVYAMNFFTNAHAQIPSMDTYYYSVCLNHSVYTLGTSCSGSYASLFSLGATTNSHAWRNSALARTRAPGYYNWNNICVNVLNPGINIEIIESVEEPSPLYQCVGRIVGDDLNGRTLANCGPGPGTRLWIRFYHFG